MDLNRGSSWHPPETWWVVDLGPTAIRVDARTAEKIRSQHSGYILIIDITEAEVWIQTDAILAIYQSTPEGRERDRMLAQVLTDEGDDNREPWEST